ncbi:hypothetical protein CH333_01450 [candidate division WOR-3 bacterium JGI_Cruoil_03_44_89]|mgnify:CR=1 FL=1|uniref:Uncharacterized protein n=1 Tax=candidate division WOR-3 bacterium JGI_Cruoil_03_44_89 TaxID=1973748 RepID=A0A235BY12_UNCW3|nr:MAG: hypothetical protein CH333_04695 [candidate division WOR-3 bacterium JGI_Cruoil_03_44_89]OYD17233.1 MAG: hypothetical protein CH333_01450 [candidate division WOR-3 bacterium JGI_Cruoil_03_44_89]
MFVKIPFGKETLDVEIPSSGVAGVYSPNSVECGDDREILGSAIENPLDSPPFEEFIRDGTVIIVNDDTRPTPTARVLEIIYRKLKGRNLRFIVACGSHSAPTEKGLEFIFGRHLGELRDKIHIHDAEKDQFVSLGRDKYRNPLEVSKIVHDAPRVITISSVEPHYFAGFMGGRKSFLPGVASYKTIESNHSLALNPRATTLNLRDNPVHLGMLELTRKFGEKKVFAIQLVIDENGKIYRVYSGNIEKAFERCIDPCKEVSCVGLEEPVDIAVGVAGYPTDIDFYQSQKSIDNVKLAVKKGGAILLVSACREGVGNRGFIDIFEKAGSPERAMKLVKKNFKLGYQKTYKLAEILLEKEIWGYAAVDSSVLRSCFIKPVSDLNKTLNEEAKKGKKIAFFPLGNTTIPFISKQMLL